MMDFTIGVVLVFSAATWAAISAQARWNLEVSRLPQLAVATGERLVVTHNGPAVLGATVTVNAKILDDLNPRVTNNYGLCNYGFLFTDDADPRNTFMDFSKSCSSEWQITYEPGMDEATVYNISVVAYYIKRGMRYFPTTIVNTTIDVTEYLSGDIEVYQTGLAIPHESPIFLHAGVTARIKLTAPDEELLTRLGATFKTDWSFEVEPCNGCTSDKSSVWSMARNAQPGSSYDLTFTSFHGSYVEMRARLCAMVRDDTDLASLGNTYGFFYRRFLLLDPLAAAGLSNFTVESVQKSGRVVVGDDDQVDTLIIEN